MKTKIITILFAACLLMIGCEKKPVKKVADANATEKVAAIEQNDIRAEIPRVRGERQGRFGERIGRFDPASMLQRLDPNSLEKLKADFPNLDFNEPNAVRENQDAMRAIGELMRARGPSGFIPGGFGEVRPEMGEPNAAEPNELVALNLKSIQINKIIEQLTEWAGKTVAPVSPELEKQTITVYSPRNLPKDEALIQLYTALKAAGITHVEEDGIIVLKPLKEAKFEQIPVIPPEESLADLKDKTLIVQKFFKLESYSATQMGQIIQPLVGEHGYISADENTKTIVVIDFVGNLLRLEEIIKLYDVPEAGPGTTARIFELKYTDPAEIVQLLNQLLSTQTTVGTRVTRPSRTFGGFGERTTPQPTTPSVSEAPREVKAPAVTGVASSVTIQATKGPIILYAESKRRWIIARASVEDMKTIEELIKKLDVKTEAESQWETIPLKYVSASEVEDAINSSLREMSATIGAQNVYVQPLENAKQLLVFGSKENREIIKKLVENIDVPAPVIPSKTFKLKYRDSDEVKQKIDEHYQAATSTTAARRGFYPFGYRAIQPEEVYVISFPSTNEVTVRAPEATLKQIEALIEEWDKPPIVVKPRIIELKNTDPVQMVDMLNQLFGGGVGAVTGRSIFDIIYGRGEATEKIVGPWYGKVTFTEVPGAKKIIVISKIPEEYDNIEKFVRDLDKAEIAEMPKVVVLKYADCEDLTERLNAMFNEPGTAARILRRARGLEYIIPTEEEQQQQQQQTQEARTTTQAAAGTEYTPWWSGTGARTRVGEEMPISNIIGKVRFIPDPRSKAILVLAPSEYIDGIVSLINELDKPGKQVQIKTIIVEVDKSKLDSLGLQLASDPTAFGSLGENAITVLNQLTQTEKHGSMVFGADKKSGVALTLNMETNITTLIDFLVKKTDAKRFDEQSLWTKDNENAEFFKGQNIAFQTQASVSEIGARATYSYEYKKVGMVLRVRPNITPEKKVDMEINLEVSQLTQDLINTQPVTALMNTVTKTIVENGQTILLGRILFQEDSSIERKIPLLGDVPVIGNLFKHNSSLKSNNELLVFITPYVVDEETSPEKAIPEFESSINKMEKISEELAEQWLEKVE